MSKNKLLVVAGELSTYGKEVFDRLESLGISGAYFDKRYFEKQGKCLSLKKLREAQRNSPSFLNVLSHTHKPKYAVSDRSKKCFMIGFEVNHKDPQFQAALAEACRYVNEHRVRHEDQKQLDRFRARRGFQYALLVSDDLYDCEDDAELLVRNRLSWWVDQDKPFALRGSKNVEEFLYSFANIWNVYHDKLCTVVHIDPSTTRIVRVNFDVCQSKPPINVKDAAEFGRSLIEFLKAPHKHQPDKYAAFLRTAARYRLGDPPEFPPLIKAYEELKNPPFNKLKAIQELLRQNKLKSYISSFWEYYHP